MNEWTDGPHGEVLSVRDPEVRMRLLSRDTVNYAGDLLRKLKGRVDLVRGIPYPGKGSPSSGWIGIWFLLQFCDAVSVYGMGDSVAPVDGAATAWHYFENRHFGNSREFSIDPHHSFKLESDMLQVRGGGGRECRLDLTPGGINRLSRVHSAENV